MNISLTDNAFQINEVALTLPIGIEALQRIIGTCRHTKKPKNNIFTWDEHGLLGYSADGKMVDGILVVWEYGNYDFSPKQSFTGTFTINGQEAVAYYKANQHKRVKLFPQDEGGAIISNGISAWFDVEKDAVNAIEIKQYEAPPVKPTIPLTDIPAAYQHLVPLWKQWVDVLTSIVPANNRYYNLTNGISKDDMQAAQQIKEFTIPDVLLWFYAIQDVTYDGVTSAFCFSFYNWQYDLLPFERIPECWNEIDELQLEEDGEPDYLKGYSNKVKASGYANPKWIPIAEGRNGDFLLFDTDPSDKGTYGQIIELQNESWSREVVANSLEALVQREIGILKSGKVAHLDFILGK
jgi:cell wall assembly regulator SMI1